MIVPKIRVRTMTGTRQRSLPSCAGLPVVTDRSVAVAVASAVRPAAANGSRPMRALAAGVSCACMAAQSPADQARA